MAEKRTGRKRGGGGKGVRLSARERASILAAAKRSIARGRDPVKDLDEAGLRRLSLSAEPGAFGLTLRDANLRHRHKPGRKLIRWKEPLDFYASAEGTAAVRAAATAKKYGSSADKDDPKAFIHRLQVCKSNAVRK